MITNIFRIGCRQREIAMTAHSKQTQFEEENKYLFINDIIRCDRDHAIWWLCHRHINKNHFIVEWIRRDAWHSAGRSGARCDVVSSATGAKGHHACIQHWTNTLKNNIHLWSFVNTDNKRREEKQQDIKQVVKKIIEWNSKKIIFKD